MPSGCGVVLRFPQCAALVPHVLEPEPSLLIRGLSHGQTASHGEAVTRMQDARGVGKLFPTPLGLVGFVVPRRAVIDLDHERPGLDAVTIF